MKFFGVPIRHIFYLKTEQNVHFLHPGCPVLIAVRLQARAPNVRASLEQLDNLEIWGSSVSGIYGLRMVYIMWLIYGFYIASIWDTLW